MGLVYETEWTIALVHHPDLLELDPSPRSVLTVDLVVCCAWRKACGVVCFQRLKARCKALGSE